MKRKRNLERADRENPVWTKETFARARKAREVLPAIFGKQTADKMLKPRGRPKSGNARTSISLRLPPDILARWKATGPGWQTRLAAGGDGARLPAKAGGPAGRRRERP